MKKFLNKAVQKNIKWFFSLKRRIGLALTILAEKIFLNLRYCVNGKKQFIYIITSVYNSGEVICRTLQSVYDQDYPKSLYRHIVINDASIDSTDDAIRKWLANHPDHKVEYIKNKKRLGSCANNTRGFKMAKPGDLVVELNGDDWLYSDSTITFVNKVFANKKVWMTYNTSADPAGKRLSWTKKIPPEIVKNNSYRESTWLSSHLHAFRAELFSHVNEADLIDPDTKTYWQAAADHAHYMPMLELAGSHARHIYSILYVYNKNEKSIYNVNRDYQKQCADKINKLRKYQPLKKLVWNQSMKTVDRIQS